MRNATRTLCLENARRAISAGDQPPPFAVTKRWSWEKALKRRAIICHFYSRQQTALFAANTVHHLSCYAGSSRDLPGQSARCTTSLLPCSQNMVSVAYSVWADSLHLYTRRSEFGAGNNRFRGPYTSFRGGCSFVTRRNS